MAKAKTKVAQERIDAIKKAITQTNGSVTDTAIALGMSYQMLSRLLNHASMCVWWKRFKKERARSLERARSKKYYASHKEKHEQLRRQMEALKESGVDVDDLVGHIK